MGITTFILYIILCVIDKTPAPDMPLPTLTFQLVAPFEFFLNKHGTI